MDRLKIFCVRVILMAMVCGIGLAGLSLLAFLWWLNHVRFVL